MMMNLPKLIAKVYKLVFVKFYFKLGFFIIILFISTLNYIRIKKPFEHFGILDLSGRSLFYIHSETFELGEVYLYKVTNNDLRSGTLTNMNAVEIEIENHNNEVVKIFKKDFVGKVIFTVHYLPYLLNYFTKPFVTILFIVLPFSLVVFKEVDVLKKEFNTILRNVMPLIGYKYFMLKRKFVRKMTSASADKSNEALLD